MRKEFIEVETLAEAENLAPWEAEIIEADGGYWVFESVDDAKIYLAQE